MSECDRIALGLVPLRFINLIQCDQDEVLALRDILGSIRIAQPERRLGLVILVVDIHRFSHRLVSLGLLGTHSLGLRFFPSFCR